MENFSSQEGDINYPELQQLLIVTVSMGIERSTYLTFNSLRMTVGVKLRQTLKTVLLIPFKKTLHNKTLK